MLVVTCSGGRFGKINPYEINTEPIKPFSKLISFHSGQLQITESLNTKQRDLQNNFVNGGMFIAINRVIIKSLHKSN